MRTNIEKQFFDWSREQNPRIKAKGTMALFAQAAKVLPNLNVAKASTRSEWPLQQYNTSRYLSRKILIG